MPSVNHSYDNTPLDFKPLDDSLLEKDFNQTRDKPERESALLILDNRTLDRECLAQCLVLHGVGLKVLAFGSIDEWQKDNDLHLPVAAILINIGSRKVTDPAIAADIAQLVTEFSPKPIVVLSDIDELEQVLSALESGARGYVPSTIGLEVCVKAISLALAGGTFVPASSVLGRTVAGAGEELARPGAGMFTHRQEEVIQELRRGKANKIIAYDLNLHESTVKVHIRNIMKKLGATNRTEVAYKASQMFSAKVGTLDQPGLLRPRVC
ncbi:two component transcriptional regulator (plasmid) [Sinorhizobium fredii NGR234]|uniref:Two component transcriptional regulator n=1 Tax=Sinorhizobium fredii (strain NBRC 101917 / NGR234) TaxID=394 RepID=C3KRY5_SINFN|nr:response regulator transcription factor [Sinorhizobium fredii]ACP22843.1 two component transcriptional regulator [Sinorhizobium fredii NGR234]